MPDPSNPRKVYIAKTAMLKIIMVYQIYSARNHEIFKLYILEIFIQLSRIIFGEKRLSSFLRWVRIACAVGSVESICIRSLHCP